MCRDYGWDYWTFQNQPDWFIEELLFLKKTDIANQNHNGGQ